MKAYFDHGHCIERGADGARIPLDPGNADYAQYLAWCGAGNAPDLPAPPTEAQRKEALKAAATQKRWDIETGGITLPGGVHVLTATSDQNRITSTIATMEAIGLQAVDFKAATGWIALNLAQLCDIRRAIGLHVQACFTAERAHHEAIDQLDAAGLDNYDINTGWPVAATYLQERFNG